MIQKQNDVFSLNRPEYDFSPECSAFRERLRGQFLCAAGRDGVIPLYDEEFADLNAAGQGPLGKPGGKPLE